MNKNKKKLKKIIWGILVLFISAILTILVYGEKLNIFKNYFIIEKDSKVFLYYKILWIIELCLFFVTINIVRRKKIYKKYIKCTEVLVEPIIAETLIDGKTGLKELIMTTVVDLINRKKIRYLPLEDVIEVIDLKKLTRNEELIVDLIFEDKERIKFSEIAKIFKKSSAKANQFNRKFEHIQSRINRYLLDNEIYSVRGEFVLFLIKIICMMIFLNIIFLTLGIVGIIKDIYFIKIIIIVNSLLILSCMTYKTKKRFYFGDENKKMSKLIVFLGVLVYLIIIILNFTIHLQIFLGSILIIVLNIITYEKTTKHCLTNKGKIEYNKVYALKRYIKDYSLMNESEIDKVIVWDKFLTYACAFGIPNNIMKKIEEKDIKLNKLIQKFDTL